ncbi:MAG: hypothetical protein SF097_08735 [Acidobacteriota bacterium]|nr:hypothetical protein [Acidobacteriota bacterium]
MIVEQLIPTLKGLNRADKWRLMQVLVSDLAGEEEKLHLLPGDYPVWTPLESYDAAEEMMAFLEETRRENAISRAI